MKKRNKTPKVTDHALVRYLERKYGIDIGKLKKEILTPVNVSAILSGAKRIKVDNFEFRIADNSVITVTN